MVVIVEVAQSLIQEILLAFNLKNPGDVKLIIIGAVASFKMGILFRMTFMVLDKPAAKTGDELS